METKQMTADEKLDALGRAYRGHRERLINLYRHDVKDERLKFTVERQYGEIISQVARRMAIYDVTGRH